MNVAVTHETRIVLSAVDDRGLEVVEGELGPLQMFATSIAWCTASVVLTWAAHHEYETEGMTIEINWEYGERPGRVTRIALDVHWPALERAGHEAARNAARHCTIHHTLEHPPELNTRVLFDGKA